MIRLLGLLGPALLAGCLAMSGDEYLARGRAMLDAGLVTIREVPIEATRAMTGYENGIGVAYIGGGYCAIYVARPEDHGFVMQEIIDHELRHCGGWRHAVGMTTAYTRRP
jgi:hypothetical protein